MRRVREIVIGAVLAVAGLAMAGVALEVGVRVLRLQPDRFWIADPLLGMRLIPGKVGWWTQEAREFLVRIEISPQGWRDVPHAEEKPAGVYRVLVLGDSFAEALQVPLEQTFFRILERELQARTGRVVEVINTGISGFGTAGQVLLLRRDGARYRPDLVLLSFYPGNDVMNNSAEIEDTLVPVYGPDGAIERIQVPKRRRASAAGRKSIASRSKAYRYFRHTFLSGQPALTGMLASWGLLKPGAVNRARVRDGVPTAYYVYGPPDAVWEGAWAHTERLLGDFRAEGARLGAQVAVAIVGSREEVYPERWETLLARYPKMGSQGWSLEAPRRRVEALCADKQLPYLPLAPAMRSGRQEGEDLYFSHDGHWTAAGHRLVADLLADFVIQKKLVFSAREAGNAIL